MLNQIFRFFYPAKSAEEIKKTYNIPDKFNLHIRFTNDGYFILTCEELPGLITEAKNGKELIKMFNDAVLTYYDVPRRIGDIVHNKMDIDGYGTFILQEDHKVIQPA